MDVRPAGRFPPAVTIFEKMVMRFIPPAAVTLAIAEGMRKLGLIKQGDLKLEPTNA